jgi:alanine racemase
MNRNYSNKWSRPAFLEIDLRNLAYNVRNIKKRLGQKVEFLAVVKADGYGHGACEVSKVALKNGADSLGVAILEEGIELREKGIKSPIVIICPESYGREKGILKYNLQPTITDFKFAQLLSRKAQRQKKVAGVYIKVDTGMGRYGFLPEEAYDLVRKIKKLKNIKIKGILSQLSTSDEKDKDFALKQLSSFKHVLDQLEFLNEGKLIKSIANSGAVLDLPETYFNQVRVGLLMYGIYPSEEVSLSIEVEPVLSLKSKILFFKKVKKGTAIGYGKTFVAQRDTKVATVPLGYADGYFRLLSNKGRVLIKGKKVPIIGRVCMDAFMMDVTDVLKVKTGDEVVLIGKQGKEEITVGDVASWAQTFSYEVISRMGRRLPLVYKR